MTTVSKLWHEADSKTQSAEKRYLGVSWDDCISEIPTGLCEKLTDQKINEWNRTVDQANQLTEQISLVHNIMRDDDQRPSQYRLVYETLLGQYKNVIESLRELDPKAIDQLRSKVVARVKELEARINDLCDNWDPVYFRYFEGTVACYEKTYDLMVTLDEDSSLSNAQEIVRRTKEYLATRRWCLWQCGALDGEIITLVRDTNVEGMPQDYPIYTENELEKLFSNDVSNSTLRLIHAAKKWAGAVVTGHHSKAEPARRCRCSSTDFWQRPTNQWGSAEWLCNKCHPQPGAIVKTATRAPSNGLEGQPRRDVYREVLSAS